MAAFSKVNIILLDVYRGRRAVCVWVLSVCDHNNLFTTIYTVLYGCAAYRALAKLKVVFHRIRNARLCSSGARLERRELSFY